MSLLGRLEIAHLRATSPTLAEIMRHCLLRAGLSRAPGSSGAVLGNPKGWLGTAYHEVLERIVDVDLETQPLDAAVDHLWNEAIARQYQRAGSHSLDHRFGPPTSWAGYHLARASVLLRARDSIAERETARTHTSAASGEHFGVAIREHEFTAWGGKLSGRPDVIRNGDILDYKSGSIFEYYEDAHSEIVKAAYIRQLRIYGYLVKDALGWWPRRGLLLPLVGAGVEVALDPVSSEKEALEAVALLDSYNAKVAALAEPAAFASPSPQACKWCPFKIICPSFWQSVSPEWSGQLDGAVLEGPVDEAPRVIQGGAAMVLSVRAENGSEVPGQFQIAPLTLATHAAVSTVNGGDRVRLVGLRVRPDGTLVPTQRTVVARVCDLPTIHVGSREV